MPHNFTQLYIYILHTNIYIPNVLERVKEATEFTVTTEGICRYRYKEKPL
jgi:hypothetical protein